MSCVWCEIEEEAVDAFEAVLRPLDVRVRSRQPVKAEGRVWLELSHADFPVAWNNQTVFAVVISNDPEPPCVKWQLSRGNAHAEAAA